MISVKCFGSPVPSFVWKGIPFFLKQIRNAVSGYSSLMGRFVECVTCFLMSTQCGSREGTLVEAWVSEGLTTIFAFDCRNSMRIENFMK